MLRQFGTMGETPSIHPMKAPESNDTDALEQEVMRNAAADFMAQAGASAPVIDVEPEPRPRRATKPGGSAKKKVTFAVGLILIAGVMAGAAILGGRKETPASPLLAEIDAASKQMPARNEEPAPAESVPADASDAPAAPPVAEDSAVPPPALVGGGSPHEPVPAEEPPVPAEEPVVVIKPDPALLAEIDQPRVSAADIAELESLRQKVRSLEQTALRPTTIEVAEVLEDGVVLRDAQGRTVVVPQGGQIKAHSGRVEGR